MQLLSSMHHMLHGHGYRGEERLYPQLRPHPSTNKRHTPRPALASGAGWPYGPLSNTAAHHSAGGTASAEDEALSTLVHLACAEAFGACMPWYKAV